MKLSRRTLLTGAGAALAAPALAQQPAALPMAAITPFGFISDFSELMNAHSAGYFRDAGLQSTIHGANGTGPALAQVLAGQSQFLRASGIDVMRAHATQNQPLLAITTLYQASTFYVVSHRDRPIRSAAEMRGKRIGVVSVGGTTENFLDLMLVRDGVPPAEVRRDAVGNSPGALAFIEQNRIDGFIASNGVVVALRLANAPIEVWNTDRYAPMPSQVYITTRQVAERQPELVVRFLRGLYRSVREHVEGNYNAILDRIARDFEIPGIRDRDRLNAVKDNAVELMMAQGRDNLMRNVPALWRQGAELINQAGLFRIPNVDEIYTNDFLDRALRG